jgi:CSLREA domain-containing protein
MKMNRRLRTWMKYAIGAAALLCGLAPFAVAKWRHAAAPTWLHALTTNSVTMKSNSRAKRQSTTASAIGAPATPVTLHAAQRGAPYIALADGRAVATQYVGDSAATHALQANTVQPLSLAKADFDEDGMPDLVSGYASGSFGIVTIHRGNVDALWPYGAALRNGTPPAFLPEARAFYVPEAPDFIGTGDFNADGHWDIVSARRGGNALWFLPGDGHGGFGTPQRISLSGNVTALVTGEINRPDGLTDIAVGVVSEGGAQVLVFESPAGALQASPEIFSLPSEASALAIGTLAGGKTNDLVVACGSQLVTIHGRDRKLSLGSTARASVAPAQISQQSLPFSIAALTTGNFSATTNLAALGSDGAVHLLENSGAVATAATRANAAAKFAASVSVSRAAGSSAKTLNVASTQSASLTMQQRALISRANALAASGAPKPGGAEWTVRASVTLPTSGSAAGVSGPSRMIGAHVSTSTYDDIILADSSASQVHILSDTTTAGPQARIAAARAAAAKSNSTAVDDTPGMSLAASLDSTSGAPGAVLPMRLNQHGLNGLVVLSSGQAVPSAVVPDPPIVFTVNTTTDLHDALPGDGLCADSNGLCSLRAAIEEANAEAQQSGAGPFSINFNIPITDPNRDPATGVFTIFAHSEGVIGGADTDALPAIFSTVTIDGYTQPGASPNTLANGDNAIILIQIDGSQTVVPGGDGLLPFDCVGTVVRGFSIVNFSNPAFATVNGNSEALGAFGIEDEGLGGFDEGNFLGLDATGENSIQNETGIFQGQNTPVGTNLGVTIGGTVPQARNVSSGNKSQGMTVGGGTQVQGNFVGTDRNGTTMIPNGGDGILLGAAAFVTIGGTLPGSRNILSGNSACNVDINAASSGSANVTFNDVVQGNYIGTDVTGTRGIQAVAPFNCGVLLASDADLISVGGTSPAARNVISGNGAEGVDLTSNTFQNVIQGNFIGLNAGGSAAIPNSNGGVVIDDHPAKPASPIPGFNNTIGGTAPGAGNVISGNVLNGITFFGAYVSNPIGGPVTIGNTVLGNIIGLDSTASIPIPNQQDGIYMTAAHSPMPGFNVAASNETIGGTEAGAANIVSHNSSHGIAIDSQGGGNLTVGNTIQFNGGAGVRVFSGTGNLISRNSIFGNGALGIDLDTAGPNLNSHCQANATGANNLQNAPVLTAGTGPAFISATATDPNNNTSEFSNTVAATQAGNILSLLGTFDGLPNTTFTIEFFSSPSADASGFGQGQTYLGSTTVTTPAGCSQPVAPPPVDVTTADVAATLTIPGCSFSECLAQGPSFGESYFSLVTNNGPATAHSVVWTDTLPPILTVNTHHSNQASCCSVVTTTSGTCSVSGQTVTCNLGAMPAGATATINVPFEVIAQGPVQNSANVTATEVDPNLANNNPSFNNSTQPTFPTIDHISPAAALTGGPDVPVVIYGLGFLPSTMVTFFDASFNQTALPVTGFFDNQLCGTTFCAGVQVTVPAALLATSQTDFLKVQNPGASGNSATLTVSPCSFTVTPLNTNPPSAGDTDGVEVTATPPTCSWMANSSVPWTTLVAAPPASGSGSVLFQIAPNTGSSRSGIITVAGQAITLNQVGASTCDATFNPPSISLPSAGGSGSFTVTPTSSSCLVSPNAIDSWLTAKINSVGGPINYTVAQNLGGPRTGSIVVVGEIFAVNQAAAGPCWFTLSSNSASIATTGGSGSVAVTASDPSCTWTTSTDLTFVNITSGASGTGNGTIQYTVPANPSDGRTETITVGNSGSNAAYAIQQASANACTFTLSPNSAHFASAGGAGTMLLIPSYSFCNWQLSTSDPANINFTMPSSSGQGQQDVSYTVAPNPGTSPRTLTLTAGCQTFTVNQDGAAAANPVPVITPPLIPASATAGSTGFTLTVNGTNFVNGAFVSFNGNPRTTIFVNSTQVTASILATDIATVGTPAVIVTNPTPGGGPSNSVNFSVTAASLVATTTAVVSNNNPSILGQAVMFTATITPSEDPLPLPSGTVTFKDGTITLGSGTLSSGAATLTTSLLAAGSHSITAVYGGDSNYSGSTSTAIAQVVNNPVPVITPPLVPASVFAGSAGFTLTVNGSNFVSGATATFGGASRMVTFVNSGQVTIAVQTADVATAGTPAVIVTNPGPGGGPSNSVNFNVTAAPNPAPTLTSLAPNTTAAGGAAFTLTINGTNFVANTVAQWNGSPRATTFVNATQVTAAITAADVASMGTAPVTVVNPTPGGGTSNPLTFTITDFSVSNTSGTKTVAAGQAAMYTINAAGLGGNFPGTVTFSATGLPAATTASFNPPSVAPGAGTVPTTLTLTTTARPAATAHIVPAAPHSGPTSGPNNGPMLPQLLPQFLLWLGVMSLLGLTLLLLQRIGKLTPRVATTAFLALTIVCAAGFASGCNGGYPPDITVPAGTPAGTYTITVTGTSGSVSHSTTVSLTVQ